MRGPVSFDNLTTWLLSSLKKDIKGRLREFWGLIALLFHDHDILLETKFQTLFRIKGHNDHSDI